MIQQLHTTNGSELYLSLVPLPCVGPVDSLEMIQDRLGRIDIFFTHMPRRFAKSEWKVVRSRTKSARREPLCELSINLADRKKSSRMCCIWRKMKLRPLIGASIEYSSLLFVGTGKEASGGF